MGIAQVTFAVEQCGGATGSDVSHVTGSDVSHVTGSMFCAGATGSGAMYAIVGLLTGSDKVT